MLIPDHLLNSDVKKRVDDVRNRTHQSPVSSVFKRQGLVPQPRHVYESFNDIPSGPAAISGPSATAGGSVPACSSRSNDCRGASLSVPLLRFLLRQERLWYARAAVFRVE